jgi:hypothetical protein
MVQGREDHPEGGGGDRLGPRNWCDVIKIANTRDTDLRAHRIALAYYALSVRLDDYLFGPDSFRRCNEARGAPRRSEANWFHFALWGTLTVTRNIGQDRGPERLAALPDALRRNLTPWVISARASASQEVSRALAWGQRLMFLSITAPFVELLNRESQPDKWALWDLMDAANVEPCGWLSVPLVLDLAADGRLEDLDSLPTTKKGDADQDVVNWLGDLREWVRDFTDDAWEAIALAVFGEAQQGGSPGEAGGADPHDPDLAAKVDLLLSQLSEPPADGAATEATLVPLALDWRELSELGRLSPDRSASVLEHGLIPVAWLLDAPEHWVSVLRSGPPEGAPTQAVPPAPGVADPGKVSAMQLLIDGSFARFLEAELARVGCDSLREALRAVRLRDPRCEGLSPTLESKTLEALKFETDWGRHGSERDYSAAVQERRHRLPIDEAVTWYQLVRRLHRMRRRLEVLDRHLPTESRHRDRLGRVLDELATQISRLLLAGTVRLTAVEQDLVNPAVRVTVDHFPMEVAAFVKRQLTTMGEYASGLSAQIASYGLESRFRPIEASMQSLWARFMTDQVFVMALPSETVRLGRDIPPRDFRASYFPPTLADIEAIDGGIWSTTTRCVLEQASRQVRSFDVARDRGRGSAAHDWRRFDERMRFATTLMRTRQSDPTLFWAPFVTEDIARIERGELPRRSGHPTDRQINAPLGPGEWFDDDDEGYG